MSYPDPTRAARIVRNLQLLRTSHKRLEQYDAVLQLVADCRAMRLPIISFIQPVDDDVPEPPPTPAPTGRYVCPECQKSFASHHALCGHRRVHKPERT
jgi:hypothetical protein